MSISVQESHDICTQHISKIPDIYVQNKLNSGFKVPDSKKQGYSHIFRSAASPELVETIHPRLNNLEILFQHAVNLYPNDDCLGERLYDNTIKNAADKFYTFQTYKQILERRNNIASGIIHLVTSNKKFIPNDDNFSNGKPNFIVSLYSSNRLEFMLTDLALSAYSLPSTSLYDTLGPESSRHILDLTESPLLILSKNNIEKIFNLREKYPLKNLLILISMDPLNNNNNHDSDDFKLKLKAAKLGLELIDYPTMEKLGENHFLNVNNFNLPTPDTIHQICFTSGTTGLPKGCVLTHKNMVCYIAANQILGRKMSSSYHKNYKNLIDNKDDFNEQLRYLAGLPLAHIYERTHSLANLVSGTCIGFPSLPGVTSLIDDWRILKPHSITGVPRLWNKIEQGIKLILKDYNFNQNITTTSNYNNNIKEKEIEVVDMLLIRNKVRQFFGFDKVRFIATGSAPLSHDTINYISKFSGIGFIQGFGMTETLSAIMSSDPFCYGYNTLGVGGPYLTIEIKLKDVPQLNYYNNDRPMARGELLCRGPQLFSHYYKNSKATMESFDNDGFFHTGDIAAIDDNGQCYIIDRVKNFFKLSQGEYIAPERIENTYLGNSPLLTQIFIYGDSLQNYLVGIIGIEPNAFKTFLGKTGLINTNTTTISDSELPKFFKDLNIKKKFIHEINQHVNKSGLQGFEKIHNVHLDIEPLKIEDDVVTPTLKLKRENAKKHFKEILDALYDEGSLFKKEKL